MTADSNNKKNPFFLPAFLTMLSQVLLIGAATIAVGYMDGYVDGLILELIHLMMIIAAPVATLVLSVAGIVTAIKRNKRIVGCVFGHVEKVKLETTAKTESFLKKEYPGEEWATRQPKVLKGTAMTSDRYWKGIHDHHNALSMAKTYKCEDPYAITEMEDIAIAQAVQRFGLLDRLIILRVAVNLDVFPGDTTPEMLWSPETDDHVASSGSLESVDIFETGMKNCFTAGKTVVDSILDGSLS